MNSFHGTAQRLTRLVLLTTLVAPALGGCANDASKQRSTEPRVDSSTPPASSADTSDQDSATDGAGNACIDTRLRIPIGTTCYFELPEAPPGRELDTESLNLRLAGYNGDSPLDYELKRVSDVHGCSPEEVQWYFYDEKGIPLMVLCPTTCSVGEQGGEGLLWIRAECL